MSNDTHLFVGFIKNINPKIIFEFGTYDCEDAIQYRNFFPDASIYSFEPSVELFNLAKRKATTHNIMLFNYAITNKTGKTVFFPSVLSNGIAGPSGSLIKHTDHHKKNQEGLQTFPRPMKVKSITIQDFCNTKKIKNIDYMHIDVEGAVLNVLRGFDKMRPKMLRVEVIGLSELYHGVPTKEQCHDLIKSMGYQIIYESEKRSADVLYTLK